MHKHAQSNKDSETKTKIISVLHPFLFAVFPILAVYAHNIAELSLSDTIVPLAFALGFAALLLCVSWVLYRNLGKAAVIVSVFLVIFWSYGYVQYLLESNGHPILANYLLPLATVVFLASGTIFLARTRMNLPKWTVVLNVAAVCVVLISCVNIGVYELRRPDSSSDTTASLQTDNMRGETDTGKLPDVYYIILDGYTSSANLEEFYGYDNAQFTDWLTERGFYVASDSKSNYALTFLSLASSLNMEYINYLGEGDGANSIDRTLPYQMIKDSQVMKALKSLGYKFITVSSGWGPTDANENVDLEIARHGLTEFQGMLVRMTMLYPLGREGVGTDSEEGIKQALSRLNAPHGIEGPKFVFVHLLCPHPPLGLAGEGSEDLYLDRLAFVNAQMMTFVDSILSTSNIPPIILLQADHGTASSFTDELMGGDLTTEAPTDGQLRERMGILGAYYLPGGGSEPLYGSITPVNTFRVVFDFYFGTDYGLLEDRSYYSTYQRPYDFVDVTRQAHGG